MATAAAAVIGQVRPGEKVVVQEAGGVGMTNGAFADRRYVIAGLWRGDTAGVAAVALIDDAGMAEDAAGETARAEVADRAVVAGRYVVAGFGERDRTRRTLELFAVLIERRLRESRLVGRHCADEMLQACAGGRIRRVGADRGLLGNGAGAVQQQRAEKYAMAAARKRGADRGVNLSVAAVRALRVIRSTAVHRPPRPLPFLPPFVPHGYSQSSVAAGSRRSKPDGSR